MVEAVGGTTLRRPRSRQGRREVEPRGASQDRSTPDDYRRVPRRGLSRPVFSRKESSLVKILITGAAGFIGSSLADAFLDLDHEVVGIDNFETGRRDNVPAEMQLVERDIADGVDDVVAGLAPDLVVHCAASYKDPSAWQRDIRSNVLGTA